jgi:hypothetical protein
MKNIYSFINQTNNSYQKISDDAICSYSEYLLLTFSHFYSLPILIDFSFIQLTMKLSIETIKEFLISNCKIMLTSTLKDFFLSTNEHLPHNSLRYDTLNQTLIQLLNDGYLSTYFCENIQFSL